MLKQSIVQEKLSDLNNATSQLQSQMPQWSRVQLGKHLTANLKRNNKITLPATPFEGDYYAKTTDLNGNEIEITHATLMDPTQKLKYLEKSIKFIQEQHNETLRSLHDEIEKLKIENRDLHFKLVTSQPRSPSAKSTAEKLHRLQQQQQQLQQHLQQQQNLDSNSSNSLSNKDPILERKFNKLINETANEQNLDKRLTDIKSQYENQKYEELVTRLRDAESKNEYLTNVIAQLQEKRNANSAYKPNSSDMKSRSQSASNLSKLLGINHIFSVEPLKICITENESPRAPSYEECELLIRKLYDVYKQQKQQISNMKAVLKDMLHTENLSNQGMMMTRDVLENATRFNKNFIENSLKSLKFDNNETSLKNSLVVEKLNSRKGLMDLSSLAQTKTSTYKIESKSSSKDINQATGVAKPSQQRISNVTGIFFPQYDTSGANSNSSTVHLPPLLNHNASKYIEKQRRTQLLQKQRLKKEYFN